MERNLPASGIPVCQLPDVEGRVRNVQIFCNQFLKGNVDVNLFAAEVGELWSLLQASGYGKNVRPDNEANDVVEGTSGKQRGDVIMIDLSGDAIDAVGVSMESVVGSESVLRNIFKFLSVGELKECKKMNKVWNKITNETLAQRMTFVNGRNLRALKERGVNVPEKFKEVGNCMKNCTTEWLAPGIVMDSRDWVPTKPEVREFLDNFGRRIKRLIIDFPHVLSFSGLVDLLVKDLPNLEMLQLQRSGRSEGKVETENLVFTEGVLLPALKILRLPANVDESGAYVTIVRGILYAAVNLKRIDNFSCTFATDLIALNKLDAVQDINLISVKLNPEFAAADLKLKRIKTTGMGVLAKDVLHACQNTLEELDVPVLQNFLEIFPPMLPKLRVLTLREDYVEHHCDLKNTEIMFPALKEVNLQIEFPLEDLKPYEKEEQVSHLCFLGRSHFPQVEMLRMSPDFRLVTVRDAREYFPNLTSLQIHWNMFDFECPDDWKHSYESGEKEADPFVLWDMRVPLKKLEIIDFSLDSVFGDSFFTGLPKKTCQQLQSKKKKVKMDLKVFRTKKSICVFPDLRELRLTGYGGALTCVSHWYGFSCIPGLRVILSYDFRQSGGTSKSKAINSIEPYVTVIHDDSRQRPVRRYY